MILLGSEIIIISVNDARELIGTFLSSVCINCKQSRPDTLKVLNALQAAVNIYSDNEGRGCEQP